MSCHAGRGGSADSWHQLRSLDSRALNQCPEGGDASSKTGLITDDSGHLGIVCFLCGLRSRLFGRPSEQLDSRCGTSSADRTVAPRAKGSSGAPDALDFTAAAPTSRSDSRQRSSDWHRMVCSRGTAEDVDDGTVPELYSRSVGPRTSDARIPRQTPLACVLNARAGDWGDADMRSDPVESLRSCGRPRCTRRQRLPCVHIEPKSTEREEGTPREAVRRRRCF